MRRGTHIEERIVVPELVAGLRFKWTGGQRYCEIKDPDLGTICTGHIDGFLHWQALDIACDVKSCHPSAWHKLNTIEDFDRDAWRWRYHLQLMVYLHAFQKPLGVILLDDCLGHWKLIPVFYDKAIAEALIERCRKAVQHIRAKTLPDFHDDPAHCQRCWKMEAGVCSPPMDYTERGVSVIASAELEEALTTRERCEPAKREYDAADRILGKAVKVRDPGLFLCGPFKIDITEYSQKAYEVAATTVKRKKVERFLAITEQPAEEGAA